MLCKEYSQVMDILNTCINNEIPRNDLDWEMLTTTLGTLGMDSFVYNCLWNQNRTDLIPENIHSKLRDACHYTGIKCESQRVDIIRLLTAFNEKNIQTILFKGAVIADTYPDFRCRYSSDTDILIKEEEQNAAYELMEALGYTFSEEDTKEKVKVYHNSKRNHTVELHLSLWEDYEGKQIELLNQLGMEKPSELISYEINGVSTLTLNPTNHLIFQMFHIIKHFVVKGIGIKQILDLYYFINKYYDEIDTKKFWEAMEILNYTEFAVYYLQSIVDYLKLNPAILADKKSLLDENKRDELVTELISFGLEQKTSYDIITIMSPYLEGRDEMASAGGFERRLKLIFPSPDSLQDDFSYAKKNHILLPIAWVHKWMRFIGNRLSGKSTSAKEKMQEADKRLRLMQDFGLMK